MITDLHSHYFPIEATRGQAGSPVELTERPDGRYQFVAGSQQMVLDAGLFDLDRQLADLRRQGLDRRVLMVPPFTALYELPVAEGLDWSRRLNDGIAAAMRAHPEALIGFATVPLQDVGAAVGEFDRAVGELGLRGVEILTSVNGVGLDAPDLDPFWGALEQSGLPALIHPHDVSGAARMGDYYLRNLVGNPTETALAGARLLFGGVLERYPRLKLILSHGGGALPHLIGRLGHGFAVRPEARLRAEAPLEQLRRLYYDTIVFEPMILRHLVEIVGTSQVVLGTDYPFDMAEDDPVGFVRSSGLSSTDCDLILNAADRLIPNDRTTR